MAKKKSKIARQKDLPGMEDRKIASIENAAQDYAEIRDQRHISEPHWMLVGELPNHDVALLLVLPYWKIFVTSGTHNSGS